MAFTFVTERVDYNGNVSRKTYNLTSADYAAAVTDAGQIIGYENGVTNMSLKRSILSEVTDNAGYALPASPLVQREVVAVITARDSVNPTKTHTINIIGADPDVVFYQVPGDQSKKVDFTDSAVQDYVNLYSVAGESYLSDGESIADDGWIDGNRTTKKNSRG